MDHGGVTIFGVIDLEALPIGVSWPRVCRRAARPLSAFPVSGLHSGQWTTMEASGKTVTVDNTHRHAGSLTSPASNGSSSCCMIGGLAGVALVLSGVNLALGGVLSDHSFTLSGIQVPLSCLASAMVLAGTFVFAITRRHGAPIDF